MKYGIRNISLLLKTPPFRIVLHCVHKVKYFFPNSLNNNNKLQKYSPYTHANVTLPHTCNLGKFKQNKPFFIFLFYMYFLIFYFFKFLLYFPLLFNPFRPASPQHNHHTIVHVPGSSLSFLNLLRNPKLLYLFKFLFIDFQRERNRDIEFYCPTYLCIHWLILILCPDWGLNP